MKQYRLWVRISLTQTADTIVMATNDYYAKQIGESLFGAGNVLGFSVINDA